MSKAVTSVLNPNRMRIIALPLTSRSSSTGLHTFYHFQTPLENSSKGGSNILKRVIGKVSEVWTGFGKAEEGSWRVGEHVHLRNKKE